MTHSSTPKTQYDAQYSDGSSAAVTNVVLTIAENGLLIHDVNRETLIAQWPFDDLTSINDLDPERAAQLSTKQAPESRVFFKNDALTRELAQKMPRLTTKSRSTKTILYSLLTGLSIVGLGALLFFSNLNIAHKIAKRIPDSTRTMIGENVINFMTKEKEACHSPEGRAALDIIVNRLHKNNKSDHKFKVTVAPLGMVNAFATPGEFIVLSKKLLEFVESPEELAGVLAHEMGHGIHLHPETGLVRSMGMTTVMQLIFGYNGNNLASIGSFLLQMEYSRAAETQADRTALILLKAAQISKNRFAHFFTKLAKKSDFDFEDENENENKEKTEKKKDKLDDTIKKAFKVISSHPLSKDRIKMIKDTADWNSTPLLTVTQWTALQKICD